MHRQCTQTQALSQAQLRSLLANTILSLRLSLVTTADRLLCLSHLCLSVQPETGHTAILTLRHNAVTFACCLSVCLLAMLNRSPQMSDLHKCLCTKRDFCFLSQNILLGCSICLMLHSFQQNYSLTGPPAIHRH